MSSSYHTTVYVFHEIGMLLLIINCIFKPFTWMEIAPCVPHKVVCTCLMLHIVKNWGLHDLNQPTLMLLLIEQT